MKWVGWLVACAWWLGGAAQAAYAGEVRAAVAANFSAPMRLIAEAFRQDTGHTVKPSFGSSGKFYAQVRQGAPFDVLLAADMAIPEQLEVEGLAVSGTRFVYALGRLALWSAQPGYMDDGGAVLRQGRYRKLAYADPKLAPYGRAAKEALAGLGLWDAVQDRLVTGENVTQAYQFAASGNAELAFVALSQISRDGKVQAGSCWVVPEHLYHPIRQGAVLLAAARDRAAAQALLAYLQGARARAVIRSFGYGQP